MNQETQQEVMRLTEELAELKRNFDSYKISQEEKNQRYDSSFNKSSQLINPIDVKTKDIVRDAAPFAFSKHFENSSGATAANYGIIFVAPSPCVFLGVAVRYNTASTSGTLNVERLHGTETLDGGDELLSSTISLSATANTTYDGSLKQTDAIFLRDGDALALKDAGTLTSLVGLCVTIKMRWI